MYRFKKLKEEKKIAVKKERKQQTYRDERASVTGVFVHAGYYNKNTKLEKIRYF